MTSMVVGYQLINPNKMMQQSWGGEWGSCPEKPSILYLPDHIQVLGPELDTDYEGYTLIEWIMEEPVV